MNARARDFAARKELLTAQADLSRLQLALAWDDVRASILPARSEGALFSGSHRIAAFLFGIAAPVIGRTRFTKALRYLSIALGIYRAIRSLRG